MSRLIVPSAVVLWLGLTLLLSRLRWFSRPTLVARLRPYSAAKVHARQVSLATVRGMLDGFQNDVVPKVAATARTTPAAVAADLAAADERLSPTHQAETEAHLKRFASVIDFSVRIQPLLVDSTRLPARALTWLLIIPGAALVLAGAIGLRGFRRAA